MVGFNNSFDTLYVILETIYQVNHLAAASKNKYNNNQVTTEKT